MKKVAIILGGTVPHVELIRQLKEREYYTILVDYLLDSPAKEYADEHIQESTLDKDAVLKIAQERNASLVISACVDQANITACYVLEKLGLYAPYSYETAKNITNKGYMKKVMLEKNIPTSQYIYVSETDSIYSKVNFPVMIKPADSNSANGVKRATNEKELREYLSEALNISRNKRAIIEGYVEGIEISAYCFVKDKKAKLLMTAERISLEDGTDRVIKCYASIAPARITKEMEKKAEDIATQIARAFDLDNTPLFFQGIINEDGIFVIEFAPRVAGGISYKTILENTGFDIISAAIDSYLGERREYRYSLPKDIYVVNTIYGQDGIFECVEGKDRLLQEGVIKEFFLHKKRGAVIDNASASKSRVGAFIVEARDMNEAYKKVELAYQEIRIFNDSNMDITRRELNIATQLNK